MLILARITQAIFLNWFSPILTHNSFYQLMWLLQIFRMIMQYTLTSLLPMTVPVNQHPLKIFPFLITHFLTLVHNSLLVFSLFLRISVLIHIPKIVLTTLKAFFRTLYTRNAKTRLLYPSFYSSHSTHLLNKLKTEERTNNSTFKRCCNLRKLYSESIDLTLLFMYTHLLIPTLIYLIALNC